jgi:hypothetical protein
MRKSLSRVGLMKLVYIKEPFKKSSVIAEWADLCSIFFLAYGIFPPFVFSREFAKKGVLDNGMSGYVEWVPFDLSAGDHENIFLHLKEKNKKLINPHIPSHIQVETFDDLAIWQHWVAFGIPYDEHRTLLIKCKKLEGEFRELQKIGKHQLAFKVYADLIRSQDDLINYCSPYIKK